MSTKQFVRIHIPLFILTILMGMWTSCSETTPTPDQSKTRRLCRPFKPSTPVESHMVDTIYHVHDTIWMQTNDPSENGTPVKMVILR